MAILSPTICSISFLLCLLVGALMMPSSEGKSCMDYLGGGCINDDDCTPKCGDKHPGGHGYCYAPIPTFKTCYCDYQCGPPEQPEPKRNCNAGLGPCSRKSCSDSCCNSKCASKYNNGIGFCDNSGGGVSLCQCKYACN